MTADIVVVGSINMDLLAVTPRLPRPGETVLAETFRTARGGKGANQAIGVARAGFGCAMIGAVGDDAFAPRLRHGLDTAGVDTSGVRTVGGPSGVAMITVDGSGENHIVVASGANAAATSLTDTDRATIATADTVLCQLEMPLSLVADTVRAASASGTRIVLNAAPARPLPDDLLNRVDVLVVNAVEAAMLTDGTVDDPRELCEALARKVSNVALTVGGDGCWLASDGTVAHIPAVPATVVDTTGAGDAFTAVLAAHWADGPREAARLACAAGSVCVERHGADLPRKAEIARRHREFHRA